MILSGDRVDYFQCMVCRDENGQDVVYVPLSFHDSSDWRCLLFSMIEGDYARAENLVVDRGKLVVLKRFDQKQWFGGLRESETLQLLQNHLDKHKQETSKSAHNYIVEYVSTILDNFNKEQFIVSKYFPSVTLEFFNLHYCAHHGRLLPIQNIREITIQCIKALYILHCENGVVHLNITGGNLLVQSTIVVSDNSSENMCSKLIDFECSMASNRSGYDNFEEFIQFLEEQYIGCNNLSDLDLDSKPPELFWERYRSSPYHPESVDVWALGILVMKLLTGGHNFLALDFNSNKVILEMSPWFQLLRANRIEFIRHFSTCTHSSDEDLIELMTMMLSPYPVHRINVGQLYEKVKNY